MANTYNEFDLSTDPSAAVLASAFSPLVRQFSLTNAAQGAGYVLEGSMEGVEPPSNDSWYSIETLNGPSGRKVLDDRSWWYRITGGGPGTTARVFMTTSEPDSGVVVAQGTLVDGIGTVTFPSFVSFDTTVVASYASTANSDVIGTLEATWAMDGVDLVVTVRSMVGSGGVLVVEVGDQSDFNVMAK